MKNYISELQKKPYETRVKILWGTTAVIAAIIIGVWSLTLKDTIRSAGPLSLTPPQSQDNQSESSFITVERAERTPTGLAIYFNVSNPTDDILTFSKMSEVEMKAKDGNKKATSLVDRQGLPMVQKILSRTQAFGTVIFEDTQEKEASLIFNSMFFEKTPDQTLKQTIQLNLETLIQNSEVRN